MDQVRVVNASHRREKRVSMSIFTWALDISVRIQVLQIPQKASALVSLLLRFH
jgi:hypothetical protein